MPVSALDPPTIPEIEEYLKAVLPNAAFNYVEVGGARHPLLIVRNSNVVSCFGFSNERVRQNYEILYSGFKQHYLNHERDLESVDLAFVYCIPSTTPDLDQFCSSIETEVFFCRKFVIPLMHPLNTSFSRLPFLPLAPLHGPSLRPASAQTLLQRAGVPAALARHLVVQQERGAERIIDDCLSGEHNDPKELVASADFNRIDSQLTGSPVKLSAITIENFRAYRKSQTFDLGDSVTILYGPNGFGKTSIFDAIDFVATGGIGRLRATSDPHFEKTATHLDSEPSQSVVSLTFKESSGSSRRLSRTVSDRRNALLDGQPTDRKKVLATLTGGGNSGVDRIENFVNLFRATHLFSQEQQEFTRDFQEDFKLSGEIVSRMLAFEDYANAVNKVTEVLGNLDKRAKSASEEISQLTKELDGDKAEIASLADSKRKKTTSKALKPALDSLANRLKAVGITSQSNVSEIDQVRGWRGLIERRLGECETSISKLHSLAEEAQESPKLTDERVALVRQITAAETHLKNLEIDRSKAELAWQAAVQRASKISQELNLTQDRLNLIEWIREQRPILLSLRETRRAAEVEFAENQSEQNKFQLAFEKALGEFSHNESVERDTTERLRSKQNELSALQNLGARFRSGQHIPNRVQEIEELKVTHAKSLNELKSTESELLSKLQMAEAEADSLSRHIADMTENQTEVRKLLTELQGHVIDGICPLCGDDHGNKLELSKRIQSRLSVDVISGAQETLNSVRQRLRTITDQISINRREQGNHRNAIEQLSKELSANTAQLAELAGSAAAAGLDASGQNVDAELRSKAQTVQNEIVGLRNTLQSSQSAAKSARDAMTEARSKNVAVSVRISELQSRLESTTAAIDKLLSNPRLDQIGIEVDEEFLRLNLISGRENLTKQQSDSSVAKADESNMRVQVDKLEQEIATRTTSLTSLRSQHIRLQERITEFSARLSEAGFQEPSSGHIILQAASNQARDKAALQTLLSEVLNLELALDAATTAAAYDRLRRNAKAKQDSISRIMQALKEIRPWVKYFSDILHLVSSQQNDAIEVFARIYGPRTSVIQKRLRSVYGFDDVEIASDESAITVRVTRRGEELRPTDFFSQSQQQTLLLGLFLTACSSQNWSTFAPIFLDDPVTHFDDLNTYALLDLISGLLDADLNRHQFIISTCDEKLLDLARQKFRYMGQRAKFYSFSSISGSGPEVSEITSLQDAPSESVN